MRLFFTLVVALFLGLPCSTIFGIDRFGALRGAIEDFVFTHPGYISVSFVDLRTDRKVAVAEDRLYNPASVIKIPVMVEVYRQISVGKMTLDDQLVLRQADKLSGSGALQYHQVGNRYSVRQLLELMITQSDNTATRMLIESVGKENINATMRQMGLKNTVIRTSNLLRAEGLNFSTAGDMTILMAKIFKGTAINPEVSKEMLATLGRQQIKWGIPRFLPSYVKVANKTGTLAHIKNDTGIVLLETRPYVVSVFTSKAADRPFDTLWVAQLSRLIFDWNQLLNEEQTLAQRH